jgi:hypothetical protein
MAIKGRNVYLLNDGTNRVVIDGVFFQFSFIHFTTGCKNQSSQTKRLYVHFHISAVSLHGRVLITFSFWAVLVNNCNMKSHNNKNNLISRLSNNHFYIACGRSRVRFSYQTLVIVTRLLWFSSGIQKDVTIVPPLPFHAT